MEPFPFRILFRTYSSSSAGTNSRKGFRSGDTNRRELDYSELAEHFMNHGNLDNRKCTCLISTTDDPVRSLKLGIDMECRGDDNIYIAIIRSNNYLPGDALATYFEHENDALFKTEFFFFWEIEATEILHVVSLDTLLGRGLLNNFKVLNPKYWEGDTLPPLGRIREEICENNENAWDYNRKTWPERSGGYVAAIAKCFGSGAPQRAIASLIWECGTHFEPDDYEDEELALRVRNAIRKALDKPSCRHDKWCGELARP